MKHLNHILLGLLCLFSTSLLAQVPNANCGATAGQLNCSGSITTLNPGDPTSSPVYSVSPAGLPNTEFAITNPNQLADDGFGPQIIAIDDDGVFDPITIGFQPGDTLCVTPVSYNLVQVQTLIDDIYNNSFFFTPCCNLVDLINPGFCANLQAAGINQGSDLQNLNDILNLVLLLDTTASNISIESFILEIDSLNNDASTLPASCGGDQLPICYAAETSLGNPCCYYIDLPVTIALSLTDSIVSIYDPAFMLAGGTPSGGTYSGPGVSGGMFDPSTAGRGWHEISYSDGTNSAIDTIYVCGADKFEPNDNQLEAALLPRVGVNQNAYICDGVDVDWFYIEVPDDNNVKIVLESVPADFDIEVYDVSSNLVDFSDNLGTNREEIILNGLTAGDFYGIVVYSAFGEFGAGNGYHLRAQYSSNAFSGAVRQFSKTGTITYIDGFLDNASIDLFPNPAKNVVNLQVTGDVRGEAQTRIMDMTGRTHLSQKWMLQGGESTLEMSIESLAQGVYFVETLINGHKVTQRLIKE